MAQDLLAPVAPLLPVLDLDRPTFLASQPSWLASRITAEDRSEHRRILRDAMGRQIGEVRTLPASLMLTGSMRAILTRRVVELEEALRPGPPETILDRVSLLLNRYLRNLTDDDLAVRAETYLDALDGLPGWVVREAVRRWFGGKCGGETKDYNYIPSEARLRQVSDGIVRATEGQIINFRRLLAAEVEPEITDEVRARQAAELQGLLSDMRRKVVQPRRAPQPPQPPPMADRATVAADLEGRRLRRVERAEGERVEAGEDAVAVTPADA